MVKNLLGVTPRWVQLVAAAVIGPVILVPLSGHISVYFIFELLYIGIVLRFIVLEFTTHASREIAAAVLGLLFGLVTSIIALTDLSIMSSVNTFYYRMIYEVPVKTIITIVMVLPAVDNKKYLPVGVVGGIIAHALLLLLI